MKTAQTALTILLLLATSVRADPFLNYQVQTSSPKQELPQHKSVVFPLPDLTCLNVTLEEYCDLTVKICEDCGEIEPLPLAPFEPEIVDLKTIIPWWVPLALVGIPLGTWAVIASNRGRPGLSQPNPPIVINPVIPTPTPEGPGAEPIPEPATLVLMLLGLGATAAHFALRRYGSGMAARIRQFYKNARSVTDLEILYFVAMACVIIHGIAKLGSGVIGLARYTFTKVLN